MLRYKPLAEISILIILITLISTCGPAPTPAPSTTPAPPTPTATSRPPTATSVPATPTATSLPPLTGSGGGRIVFSSRRGEGDYEVYVMNADGTDKRQVTRDALESEEPAWSPDGTQIAYNIDDYAGNCDIYVINADGTNRRRLTTEGNAGGPTWSPDGTQMAFSRHARAGGQDLYLMAVPDGMAAGSTNQQRLTQTGRDREALSPSWSPDGEHIACVVDFNPDARTRDLAIYVLNVQDALQEGETSVEDMQALPRVSERMNDQPAWSPTGSQIVFSAVMGSHRDLYVVNADGTDLQQLTDTPDFDEYAPAWSPNGTQIVFQANPDAQWDIYVMNADGTGRRRLTTDVANDTSPDWAP